MSAVDEAEGAGDASPSAAAELPAAAVAAPQDADGARKLPLPELGSPLGDRPHTSESGTRSNLKSALAADGSPSRKASNGAFGSLSRKESAGVAFRPTVDERTFRPTVNEGEQDADEAFTSFGLPRDASSKRSGGLKKGPPSGRRASNASAVSLRRRGSNASSVASLRKTGTFRISTDRDVQRKEMVEFLNFLRFSRSICCALPFTLALWGVFLFLVIRHGHIWPSYELRSSLTTYVSNITADRSYGLAPSRVWTAEEAGTACQCICVPGDTTTMDFCERRAAGQDGPHVSYQGTVSSDHLLQLQTAGEYFNWGKAVSEAAPDSALMREVTRDELQLDDIHSLADVWFWIQHGFVPALWKEKQEGLPVNLGTFFNATTDSTAEELEERLLTWNKIIGGLRMRQRRLTETDCTERQDLVDFYDLECHSKQQSTKAFSIGEGFQADGFLPLAENSDAYDVYLDISLPVHIALEQIEYMLKRHEWLSEATKELELQVPLLNAETVPPLFGLLKVTFFFDRSGMISHEVDVRSVAVDVYSTLVDFFLDVVWLFLLVGFLIWKVLQVVRQVRKPDGWSLNLWSSLDWATIIVGFCWLVAWIAFASETGLLEEAVEDLPPPPAYGAASRVVSDYHIAWGAVLDDLQSVISMQEGVHLGMFWYTLLLILFACRQYQAQPRLAQLSGSVLAAAEDLLHWLCVFMVAFISFAFGGLMIFGLVLENWSTPQKAVSSTLAALIGDLDLLAMFEVAPVSAVVWFMLYIGCVVFIMSNLLIAITYDHYSRIRATSGSTTGVLDGVRVAVGDWRFRTICCCRRRVDGNISSVSAIMKDLMNRCGISKSEKRLARQTVIGPKLLRRHLEQAVFNNQAEAVDILARSSEAALFDLNMMDVDGEYVDWLIENCQKHVDREYVAEDFKLAQLRELVVQAEAEMAFMKSRLESLRGSLKGGLVDVSGRMYALEKIIHTNLAELVLISGSAGVTEKAYKEPGLTEEQRAKTNTVLARVMKHTPDVDKVHAEKEVAAMHRSHMQMLARTAQVHRLKKGAM
mmetsp:Transcript_12379/g.29095  ORF Transcript_12379/g.29095 Transcript_12379/m.29095 type:complete len:1039 (+) Transcript_12379:83-3199(+)